MIYDLIVVGNGIAAQTFLFELFTKLDVKKRQNFSVAQIYSEEIAASCSLRTTATVSLSGIEEGVSDLGNELRESYFLFEEFQKTHNPAGVEKVAQVISYSNDKDRAKMIRRYKVLKKVSHPILKEEQEGIQLNSYLVQPLLFNSWFKDQLSHHDIVQKKKFLKKFTKINDGIIECELHNNEVLKTKKIVLCTGAYAKLFSEFSDETLDFKNTQTVPGSFLERSVNLLRPSFYVTINELNLIYRSEEQTLIVGSASSNGGIIMADYKELNGILDMFNQKCNFSIGHLSDFKIVTGLRHKGVRRRAIAKALDLEKNIYMISGLYKNGFTSSHLCAKKVLSEINL
ncbi:MAG: hypothetical protein H7281_13885 [Bacteriovorax sp.]|nr:hypothetical protein [Bacteriovorax sp.]